MQRGITVSACAEQVFTLAVIGAYYALARKQEGRFTWVGWFLGAAKAPSY